MGSMNVTVRADGGSEIGYGHLMRTSTILKTVGQNVDLEVRYLVHPWCDTAPIEEAGWSVEVVEDDSWIDGVKPDDGPLLIDSYETTVEQLERLRGTGAMVVMLEDGQRLERYPVDLLIDSAPGASKLAYQGEVATLFALGVQYLPLRREFLTLDRLDTLRDRTPHILLTFGGSDPEDLSSRLLPMVERMEGVGRITVVLGPGYQGRVSPSDAGGRVVILRNVNRMAELMQDADLAISAAGGTALELAYVGVPTLLLPLTQDQEPIATALVEAGASRMLSFAKGEGETVAEQIGNILKDRDARLAMNRAGRTLVDGRGAERIAHLMLDQWRGRM